MARGVSDSEWSPVVVVSVLLRGLVGGGGLNLMVRCVRWLGALLYSV